MLKVCHMTSVHRTADTRIFQKQCVSLAKAGHEVYLVGRGESREENGVHVIGVGQPTGGRLSRMTGFARKVYDAALAVDAEVYQFHDPELMPYALKLKRKGKKVIFDSHEKYGEQIRNKYYLGKLRDLVARVYLRYEAYVAKRVDAVIVVTPQMVDIFRKNQPNIAVIANYPILSTAQEVEQNRKALCFAGGISQQWNHETVLQVLERLPDVSYELCGKAEGAYLEKLQAMPTWHSVNYHGMLPFAQTQAVINRSSVGLALLSPSGNTDGQNGTLGNTKLFEMMMAGLPIVCTDFVLWKEIVDRYHCGICVKPDDVEAVTAAVRYLLEHPEEARQMGQNGRKAVEERYNWDKNAAELHNVYQKMGGWVHHLCRRSNA